MATAVKKLPKVSGNKAPAKNTGKPAKNVPSIKTPKVNTGKGVKGVSTGKSGGSKKLPSKSTNAKVNVGKKIVPVGTQAPAKTAKGMKKAKGFRGPFNQ
jgi:hypothetical protein